MTESGRPLIVDPNNPGMGMCYLVPAPRDGGSVAHDVMLSVVRISWYIALGVFSVALGASPGCAQRRGGEADVAAAVLSQQFETVFAIRGAALKDAHSKDWARKLRLPFANLEHAMSQLGVTALESLLASSESLLVGASNFRPPETQTGFGGVRSTYCYVAPLRQRAMFSLGEAAVGHARSNNQTTPTWSWSGAASAEGGPPEEFHAMQIEGSYVLVCNDPVTAQGIASLLTNGEPLPNPTADWVTFKGSEFWGYRAPDQQSRRSSAGGIADLGAGLTALSVHLDQSQRQLVLRLNDSTRFASAKLDEFGRLPPFVAVGLGIWETRVALDQESAWEAFIVIMSLFGFGIYV